MTRGKNRLCNTLLTSLCHLLYMSLCFLCLALSLCCLHLSNMDENFWKRYARNWQGCWSKRLEAIRVAANCDARPYVLLQTATPEGHTSCCKLRRQKAIRLAANYDARRPYVLLQTATPEGHTSCCKLRCQKAIRLAANFDARRAYVLLQTATPEGRRPFRGAPQWKSEGNYFQWYP